MKTGTTFLLAIVLISFIIQSGNLLLDKTGFDKLFKMISGIIIIITIIHFVSLIRIDNLTLPKSDFVEYENSDLKNEFENNLINAINDDLHKMNYVNINIDVETDFKTLKIYVYGISDESASQAVYKFLKNKYCTPNDEVFICD